MSRLLQQRFLDEETENFEAFDCVTEALEKIDSYKRSEKNENVLDEADNLLSRAQKLNGERRYIKAEYLRAMVSYLRGNSEDAISRFQELRGASGDASFNDELAYNLAAAFSEDRRWRDAVREFNGVINRKGVSPNLRLIARAGKALVYAQRVTQVKWRLRRRAREEGAEAERAKKEDARRVKRDSRRIDRQHDSIKEELGEREGGEGFDREVLEETEEILREAYMRARRYVATREIKLLPPEAPKKKRWRLSARERRIILLVAALIFLLVIAGAVIVALFVGWDYFF
jgi:tetratricopeptide (TPR) repeat protein